MHAPATSTKPDLVPIRRALISVSDKTGIVDFASALQKEFNIELISTGGTAKALRDAGLKVADISDVTGFPEMMGGRVKTLHPLVHGGFLALRDNAEHLASMQEHNIQPIDLVVVNLYPFEATIAKPDYTFEEAIENIDIGGPAMIRSAAKNHRSVAVVTDVVQYAKLLKHLRRNAGQTPYQFRLDLAMWAYTKTAQYDAAIYPYLARTYFPEKAKQHFLDRAPGTPDTPEDADLLASAIGLTPALTPILKRKEVLRYGENPLQFAAFYTQHSGLSTQNSISTATQLHGKALSYINILDADAAIELVREFDRPAAAVIKHTNPCGTAVADTLSAAFDLAYAGDPVAAFGGILALNRPVDESTATAIASGKRFLEVIIAPTFTPEALTLLQSRWKDCRILAIGNLESQGATPGATGLRSSQTRAEGGATVPLHFRSVTGGMLVQTPDTPGFDRPHVTVASTREPTGAEWLDASFVWLATKHIKSNAIAIAKAGQLLGAGAGQMSRVTSSRLAIELARQNGHADKLAGAAAGSDAFFPFSDGPQILIDAGITLIVQPGGSKKDQDTIDLCNKHNVALLFTHQRHFRH